MYQASCFSTPLPDGYGSACNRIWRAIRHIQQKQPHIKQDALLAHPDIIALNRHVRRDEIIEGFNYPMMSFRADICVEYANSAYWSIDEAISLLAGIDPFYFTLRPKDNVPRTHKRRARITKQVKQAYQTPELSVAVRDGALSVRPQHFCRWALESGLVDEALLDFFTEIKSLRPDASYDADPLRASTTVNPQG